VTLNNKQKSLCQLTTTELFPKETKNRETERKLQKRVWWVLCLRSVVSALKLKYKTLQISPPIEDFLATAPIWTSHYFARRFPCVWFFAVWKSNIVVPVWWTNVGVSFWCRNPMLRFGVLPSVDVACEEWLSLHAEMLVSPNANNEAA